MKEENFSPKQSLQLIRSMISKTKQDMSDNSIHFLVWGWITFLAIGSTFVSYDYQMLFGAAAILASYIIPAYMLRSRKKTANN